MIGADELREVHEAQLLQTMLEITDEVREAYPDDLDAQAQAMGVRVSVQIASADQEVAADLWLAHLRSVHLKEVEGRL